MEVEKVASEDTLQEKRHCAFCLQLKPYILCSGCQRRAYCSEKCQQLDFSPYGKGQGHVNYCKLECCEEDIDWEVKPVPGKGLGIVAKRLIPSKSRIIVEGIHFNPNSHPAIEDLYPEDASLQKKFKENCLEGDKYTQGRSYVALRISRVNHSCDPNAAHTYCETSKVEILYACRDIQEGDEICFSYKLLTNLKPAVNSSVSTMAMEFKVIRESLQITWEFTCPLDCRCRDKTFMEDVLYLRRRYGKFKRFATSYSPKQSYFQIADEILALQNKLKVSWIAKSNIHDMAAHFAMENPPLFKIALDHTRKL